MTFDNIPFFEEHEFDSPDLPGSGKNMKLSFIKKLTKARMAADTAFIITSGYRTQAHNSKLPGAVKDSAHTKGLAADIKANNSRVRYMILQGAIRAGFHRIGIADTFIHLDDDTTKPAKVSWLYPQKRKFIFF